MRSCNICMRPLPSGETSLLLGPVSVVSFGYAIQFNDTCLDDPNDAFWLAQTYFMMHQYSRAERLLTRPFSTSPPHRPSSPPTQMTNGQLPASAKGKGRELDPAVTAMPRLPMGPGGILDVPEGMQEGVSRLVDMSVACRYLAAQCQVHFGPDNVL